MSYNHLDVELDLPVATIHLDHPPANALSQEVLDDLSEALHQLEEDTEVKAIVLQGKGRFFAAGADIKQFTTFQQANQGQQLAEKGQKLFQRLETFTKPIIAAIHGAALGGGLELAMACHMRFATVDAKLGLPESNLGLLPGFGGTQRLPQLVGQPKAVEMMMSAEPVSGEEAQQLGLINRCFEEEKLFEETRSFAHQISTKGAVSLRYILQAVTEGQRHGQEKGEQIEAELFGKIFETEDAKEGIEAFLEKRKPHFQNH